MKTALIFLSTLALVLGAFTYVSVFGGTSGSYGVGPLPINANVFAAATSSSSATLPPGTATSTPAGTAGSPNFYGSAYRASPITWSDGGATFAVKAASLQENQLTFTLDVQMGGSPACVPLNLRLVADESGNLQGPAEPGFSFPDSGNCNGAPNTDYPNETATFAVDPAKLPLIFTTGGEKNIFFEVSTTTANGIDIALPSTSG